VALARRLGPGGRVIGLDRDPAMLDLAQKAVVDAGSPVTVTLIHAPYRDIRRVLDDLGLDRVQGVLLDLGLSSDQLAWEGRGFSFATDGPLDMRFDPGEPGPSAADLVNQMGETDLANLIFELGEERFSRRIARRIVEVREDEPMKTTRQLAELVRRSVPPRARHGPIDAATRTFQALRIAVNDELGQLEAALKAIPDLLAPGGRAAVISFHSLEDRRAKWAFKSNPQLTVLTKKPVTATAQELAVNPRARSAKLRVVERCPNPS
jgi:16S rRNA (cytosine1402-N4)-methyltransferase